MSDSNVDISKGLDAMFYGIPDKSDESKDEKKENIIYLDIDSIIPSQFQTRKSFSEEELLELCESIKMHGILQPVLVREKSEEEYELIAGERRWRASKQLGLETLPAILKNVSDEAAAAYTLIENIQRSNLDSIEEAKGYATLIEEFGLTHNQVAERVGKSRSTISNYLRLLALTGSVQLMLVSKEIEVGHAKLLLVFPPEEQEEIALIIIEKNLSVRATEKLIQLKKSGKTETQNINQPHLKTSEWKRSLEEKFASRVDVKMDQSGSGKIVIHVDSEEELDWIVSQVEKN